MTTGADYRGIEGLAGREPVGAVLTIGEKGPKGNPVNTDRFFFVVPTMGADGRRDHHPEFRAFNSAKPEHRQTIHGNLVHAEVDDAWEYHLKAQVLPGWPAHPDKRPACIGDGKKATRYYGKTGTDDFREIVCPNEACEFRQGHGAKPCKSWGRIYFRVRWKTDNLPEVLVKWTTQGWSSVINLQGFFEYVEGQAHALGLESYSLYGLPFVLTLSRKTKPSLGAAFPVVSIAPECDLVAFFLHQKEQLRQLGGEPQKLITSGPTDSYEQEPEVVYDDFATITPGHVRKPAEIAEEPSFASGGEPAPEGPRGAPAEPEITLDERYKRLRARCRGLGLDDTALQDAITKVGGNFPDLLPEQDAEVIAELQRVARKRRK